MSESNLGSGQYLDNNLDFQIDTTGDIKASEGVDELEKDLSVQMIFALSQFIGESPTPETEADIKRMAYRAAIADVRVSSVNRENITVEWMDSMKKFDVTVPLTTNTAEQYELIFNL